MRVTTTTASKTKFELNLAAAQNWLHTLPEHVQDFPEWDRLAKEQLIAVYAICSGEYECFSLLGRAGSGKSFTIKLAATVLKALGCEVRTIGTTGVAAQNVGGESTVNKFLGLSTGDVLPKGMVDQLTGGFRRKGVTACAVRARATSFFEADWKKDLVVIIDEISMASAELLLVAWQVLKECNSRRIRLVFCGDFRQLLPVNKEEQTAWKKYSHLSFEPAWFNAAGSNDIKVFGSLMAEGPFEKRGAMVLRPQGQQWRTLTMSLVENHRQNSADGWFVEALNALGDGYDFNHAKVRPLLSRVWLKNKTTGEFFGALNQQPYVEPEDALHVYHSNKEVAAKNAEVLNGAKGERRKYVARVTPGEWSVDEICKEVSPIEREIELAVGLKFMIRINIDERLCNGTIGTIIRLERDRIRLRLSNGEEHWVSACEIPLPKSKAGIPVGSFLQLPGHLSHAMTPWKTQGLSLSEPVVYHANWLINPTHGLAYVVASRVTKPELLYIKLPSLSRRMMDNLIHRDERVAAFIEQAEAKTAEILNGSVTTEESVAVEFVQSFVADRNIAHVFSVNGAGYTLVYCQGELVQTMTMSGEQWEPVDLPVELLLTLQQAVLEHALEKAVAEPVVEAMESPEAEQWLPVWTRNEADPTLLSYRDQWVKEVEYVANPAGQVEFDNADCTVYRHGDLVGMFIKNREAVGSKLIGDEAAFTWFHSFVKFVWFQPEGVTEPELPPATTESEVLPDVGDVDLTPVESAPGFGQVYIYNVAHKSVRRELDQRNERYIYCGSAFMGLAASVLANPYIVSKERSVEDSLKLYKVKLWQHIVARDAVYEVLAGLALKVQEGKDLYLCGWSAPMPDHCLIVRDALIAIASGRVG